MNNSKILMVAGTALFAVMAILLFVGTTSPGLFLLYGVLAIVGALAAAKGKKMDDRQRP